MAIQSVTAAKMMPRKGRESIDRDKNVALGITGVIQIMERYTTRGGDNYNMLGNLSDVELATITNCAHNERDALITGLKTIGDLVSTFDPDKSEIDHNGLGWLIKTMAESLYVLKDVEWSADSELAKRGYDSNGIVIQVED